MLRRVILFSLATFVLGLAQASASEFTFTSIDGKTFSSSSLRGTPVVIHVGTHW